MHALDEPRRFPPTLSGLRTLCRPRGPDEADAAPAEVRDRRLQLPAPGSLRRRRVSSADHLRPEPPRLDYTGGDFLLVEQQPRRQSRGESIRPGAGRAHPLHHARSPGVQRPRLLPRRDAARRQPPSLGHALQPGSHLPRTRADGRAATRPQRLDRIEACGAAARQDAAEQTDGERQGQRGEHVRRSVCPRAGGQGELEDACDADPAAIPTAPPAVARRAACRRKKASTWRRPRAQGPEEPDLAGALVDRDPHHRQDADGADHQRNAADGATAEVTTLMMRSRVDSMVSCVVIVKSSSPWWRSVSMPRMSRTTASLAATFR